MLAKAFAEDRILITLDTDFGEHVVRDGKPHHGIILPRLDDERAAIKIEVLGKLLDQFSDQLADRFVVATETRVRIGRA